MHCAIFQCAEERGLTSCQRCPEGPCVFHDHFGRICPGGDGAPANHTWRVASARARAGARRESRYPERPVPERAIPRLRWYLAAVQQFRDNGITVASSADIAAKVGVGPALVRRDLCYFGQFGIPSRGYQVEELWRSLAAVFESDGCRRVLWVGVDRLASDISVVSQFAERNWQIVAAADPDPALCGTSVADVPVRGLDALEAAIEQHGVNAAVLAVSGGEAQAVADRLVAAGVDAILNLAPVALAVPEHVVVQQADLATQLMILSYHSRGVAREGGDSGGPASARARTILGAVTARQSGGAAEPGQ
jgi:redox-sensing transcriptional repressor